MTKDLQIQILERTWNFLDNNTVHHCISNFEKCDKIKIFETEMQNNVLFILTG